MGGGWPVRFYCHLLGLGVLSILYSLFYSQVPGPSPKSQSQSLDNIFHTSFLLQDLIKVANSKAIATELSIKFSRYLRLHLAAGGHPAGQTDPQ